MGAQCDSAAPRGVPGQVQAIVHSTLHETPPGATHWSCRSMAKAAGVSRSTVRIGRKNGMTRSVGADWGPQILRKSQKS